MDLDHKLLRAALVRGIPLKARWSVNGIPLDFDFSRARQGLCGLDEIDIGADDELRQMIIFGTYEYDGGASAWIGIRIADGAVYGVDLERENALFLLNSSVAQFISTFNALDSFLGIEKAMPADIETRLREIDSIAYEHSDWRSLIEVLRGSASCKRDYT